MSDPMKLRLVQANRTEETLTFPFLPELKDIQAARDPSTIFVGGNGRNGVDELLKRLREMSEDS